jgi:hypothetical protein
MKEHDIEKYLVDQVRRIGGEARKLRWIGRRSAPDCVVLHAGRTVWVELKAPSGVPTATQLREYARLSAVGQWVCVIDSQAAVDELVYTLYTIS